MDRKVSSVTALVQLSPEAATAARFGKDLAGAVEMIWSIGTVLSLIPIWNTVPKTRA